LQLYYDLGNGFSEKDSASALVVPDTNDQNYQIEIPRKLIFNLRLDPPASRDEFVVGEISIIDGFGRPIKPFHISLKGAYPNKDISVFHLAETSLTLRTEDNAPDPQVIIPFASPLSIDIGPVHFLIRVLSELLLIFVVAMTLVLFYVPTKKTYRIELFIFVVSVGIIFLRYPGIILNPRFYAEEGSLFFWRAYHSDAFSISSLFTNHGSLGYYNFMPDFAAWVAATFFPLFYAPYATMGLSFLIQITPLYMIVTSRNPLWDSPLKKTLGSLLVLLVPLSSEIWLNTLGSQFHLGLISFLILLESGDRLSLWKKWVYRVLLLIGGFSGINSCILTPFFFLKGVRNRNRETLLHAALLTFTATLQLHSLLLSSNTRLSKLGEPYSLIANMVNTNFVSTLLGPAVANSLSRIIIGIHSNADDVLPFLLISLMIGEAICLYFLYRSNRNGWLSFTTLGAVLTVGIAVYIGMHASKWETVNPYNATRYFWFPNAMMALYVLFAMKEQPSLSKTIRCNRVVGFCLISILINGILNYDMVDEYKNMPSWRNEVTMWMQNDEKKTIALWPHGWEVELSKKKLRE